MARENELEYLIRIIISCEVLAVLDALVKVSQICSSHSASVRKFNSLGGTSVLLELLENPKYSKCTDICLSILANCCMDDTVREQVIKRRGIPIFVRILSCTKSESTTRRRACRGLANIAVSNQGARAVLLCNAIEPIVSFLSSSSTFDCRGTALRAVWILAENPECRGDLIGHKAPAITATLLSSKNVHYVREPAVRALASLTRDCSPQCALQIRDARAFKPLQAILQRSGGAVWEATFSTVVNLSAVAEARPHLGDVQVVPTLISCLNAYNLRKPSYETLFETLCLYSLESVNRASIRTAGGLVLLVKALKERSRKQLWASAVHAILQFRYDKESLAMLWDLKLVPILLEHIREYTSAHKDQHAAYKPESLVEAANGLKEMQVSTDPKGVSTRLAKEGGKLLADRVLKEAIETKSTTITKSLPLQPANDNSPKKTRLNRQKRSLMCEDEGDKICISSDPKRSCRRTQSGTIFRDYKDAEEELLDRMFKIMSWFSVKDNTENMPKRKLAGTDALLGYLRHVADPLQGAIKLMNEIMADVDSFEDIVCKGDVLKLVEAMAPCSLDSCRHCSQFGDLCKQWLTNLTKVAESSYGKGFLARCLLTGDEKLRHCCCLTLPYLVCDKSILRQLLFDYSGLDILLGILKDSSGGAAMDNFRLAVDSLKVLSTSISDKPNAQAPATATTSKASDACCLQAFEMDVHLQVDDGSRVPGNGSRLSETSEYFKAMLGGRFTEARETVIKFGDTDSVPLSIVIHFLHGCNFETCTFMSSDVPVNVLLDVLRLCDMLLLPSLQRQTEIRVKQKLTLENVWDVYNRALAFGLTGCRQAALWFGLTEKLDPEERCSSLGGLVGGEHGKQVLDDIALLVRQRLDMRKSPSSLRC